MVELTTRCYCSS